MTHTPEPTLRDLIRWCFDAKLWIAGGLLVGIVAAFLWVTLAVPQYRITMLVGPTTRTGSPDISALFPENASYALEYVLRSFGPGDSSDFMRFEAILRGPTVAARLQKQPAIVSGLEHDRRWSFSASDAPDTAEKLSAYLQKRVRVEPVGNTPMRKLTYFHNDPAFGQRLLLDLYGTTDHMIREEIRGKTASRIVWLNDTLRITNEPTHRRMLTDLLMDQEQVRMILALDEPFSATLAEAPSVSAKPVWPDRKVAFPLLGFIGAFLGFMLYMSSGRARDYGTARLQPA